MKFNIIAAKPEQIVCEIDAKDADDAIARFAKTNNSRKFNMQLIVNWGRWGILGGGRTVWAEMA